ncbi:MAG: peptidoglycan DD-metalloendopeptidase family protein [bacterium]
MWKNKLTLMLIPGSTGILKQLRIPVAIIYVVVGVVISLLFSSFFFSAEFFSDRVSDQELQALRAENEQLTERYEQLRWYLAEVEDRYTDLVKKEIHLRSIFGLEEIEPQQRQLGIGGPVSPMVELMSPAEKTALATETEVDRLLRLSEFEIEKYAEIESKMVSLQDRLNHTPSIWPSRGWLSRGYGMKNDPFTGYKQMHQGLDIANHRGTPIIATADGRVFSVGGNSGLGKIVAIDHGYGFRTRYAHLSEIKVKRGQRVKRGDIIGLMGSTGYSTGPHLHYEVIRNGKTVNPASYILN